jgi:hypothetical protein
MFKKPKKKSVKYWRNKCDKLLQEIVLLVYKECEICGGELSCGHHFVPKSISSFLRYYWKNIVPICVACHIGIELRKSHLITARIVLKRGEEWLKDLEQKSRLYVKTDRVYYEKTYKELEDLKRKFELLKPYKVCQKSNQ